MAEPTARADGSPDRPEDTETAQPGRTPGRPGGAAGERPAPARAASGPDPEPGAPAAAPEPLPETSDASGDTTSSSSRDDEVTARADGDRTAVLPAGERGPDEGDRTAVLPPSAASVPATSVPATSVPAAPASPASAPAAPRSRERAAPPAPTEAPPPPHLYSNRLVGTAWVLLAALCFEVLYLAAFALVVLVVAGPANVVLSMQQSLIATPFVWLPVVLFALFYELTVLLLNRAGRFAYVLTSLLVAAIVYVLSAVLILAMQDGGLSNEGNLGRALIAPQVVLIPLIAREVMLWTGLAVGARGRRVSRRNRVAQETYERERFASSVRGSDDGAGVGA